MNCGICQERTRFSPVVACVLVFAPGLARPYPLIPSEEYQHCIGNCNAIFEFVNKAVASHPETRETQVGPWTRAVLVYDDGDGAEVTATRPQEARA